MSNRTSDLLDTLNGAIRANPVAAGLIGAGALWMFFGGAKVPAFGGRSAAGMVRKAGNSAVSSGAGGFDAASEVMNDALTTVKEVTASSSQSVRQMSGTIRDTMSDGFERQPLLLGAIGVAIGAGIASAFAATRIENQLLGEARAEAAEKVQTFASDAADKVTSGATQVLQDVAREAVAQGLSPSGAGNAAQSLAEKAAAVGRTARESVNTQFSERTPG